MTCLLMPAPNAGGLARMLAHGVTGFLCEMRDAAPLADMRPAVRHNHLKAEGVARRGIVAVAQFTDDSANASINRALADIAGTSLRPARSPIA